MLKHAFRYYFKRQKPKNLANHSYYKSIILFKSQNILLVNSIINTDYHQFVLFVIALWTSRNKGVNTCRQNKISN